MGIQGENWREFLCAELVIPTHSVPYGLRASVSVPHLQYCSVSEGWGGGGRERK